MKPSRAIAWGSLAAAAAVALWLALAASHALRAESRDEPAPAGRAEASGLVTAGDEARAGARWGRAESTRESAAKGGKDTGPAQVVSGQVVDPKNRPVAGARVRIAADSYSFPNLDLATTTASDGRFALRAPRNCGQVLLEILARGLARMRFEDLPIGSSDLDLGRIHLAKGGRLHGRVLAPDGTPVANATILAWPRSVKERERDFWSSFTIDRTDPWDVRRRDFYPTSVTTSATGEFTLEGLAEGPNDLGVESEGFADTLARVHARTDSDDILEIRVECADRFDGLVVDTEGRPIAGALIYDKRSDSRAPWRSDVLTDSHGHFTLKSSRDAASSARIFRVLVDDNGRAGVSIVSDSELHAKNPIVVQPSSPRAHAVVKVAREPEDAFEVEPALSCEFVDDSGVRTQAWASGFGATFQRLDATTWRMKLVRSIGSRLDGSGFDGPVPGHIVATAMAPNGLEYRTALFQWPTPQASPLEVIARRNSNQVAVRGLIRTPSGDPVPGFPINVSRRGDDGPFLFGYVSATTGLDGRFTLFANSGETLWLKGRTPDWLLSESSISVADGIPTEATLVVCAGARLTGTVLVDGKPPGRPVFLGMHLSDGYDWLFRKGGEPINALESVTTDSQGRFRSIALYPCTVGLRPRSDLWIASGESDRRSELQGELVVSLEEGVDRSVVLSLDSTPKCQIFGYVISNGQPVRRCSVELRRLHEGDGPFQQATTDTGSFQFDVSGSGRYEISARHLGVRVARQIDLAQDPCPNVTLEFTTGSVVGRIEDLDGAPLAANMKLLRDGDAEAIYSECPFTTADEDGTFLFDKVVAGRWWLLVNPLSYDRPPSAFGPFETQGSKITKIPEQRLRPGVPFEARIVDESGARPAGTLKIARVDVADPIGYFTHTEELAAGRSFGRMAQAGATYHFAFHRPGEKGPETRPAVERTEILPDRWDWTGDQRYVVELLVP